MTTATPTRAEYEAYLDGMWCHGCEFLALSFEDWCTACRKAGR